MDQVKCLGVAGAVFLKLDFKNAFNSLHRAAVREGVRTAMDVSDGLLDDLSKLCAASGVGAIVQADRTPVSDHLKAAFPDLWQELALNGGEEYELLFTGSEEAVSRALAAIAISGAVLGRIVAEHPGEVRVLDGAGAALHPGRRGWDHFK